jgi:hypothetical protein
VELAVDEGVAPQPGVGEEHADLTVLDPSRGPRLLPLHAGRPVPLLEEAGLVEHEHGTGIAQVLHPTPYVAVRFMMILAAGATGMTPLGATGLRLNLTRSLPLGVHQAIDRADRLSTLRRGMIVTACLPPGVAMLGRRRGNLPR